MNCCSQDAFAARALGLMFPLYAMLRTRRAKIICHATRQIRYVSRQFDAA